MDGQKNFPPTYLDRQGLSPRAKYLFVSYSHKSSQTVYKDLFGLYDLGLNFWYDTELRNGDIWYKTVEERLADPNCCGAVFFFDENCLSGDAIEIEINLFEKYSRQRKDLFSFCVIAKEDDSVYCIVRNAFTKCAGMDTAQLQRTLPEKRVLTVLTAFNKDKIYKLRTGDYLREIVEDVRKQAPEAIADDKASLDEFKVLLGNNFRQVDGKFEVTVGSYPAKAYTESNNLIVSKIQTLPNGEKVFNDNGNYYLFEPITWILAEVSDGVAKLVAKNVLDICVGDDAAIAEKLKFLNEVAFTDAEKEMLCEAPYLPSVSDIKKLEGKADKLNVTAFVSDKNKLLFNFAWLADVKELTRKILCGFVGGAVDIDDDYTDSYGGFMPAITIKLNKQGAK